VPAHRHHRGGITHLSSPGFFNARPHYPGVARGKKGTSPAD
jgi:hypothetical protein